MVHVVHMFPAIRYYTRARGAGGDGGESVKRAEVPETKRKGEDFL